jgi:hypothetical protein
MSHGDACIPDPTVASDFRIVAISPVQALL